jgi:hypothetical protein
MAATPDWAEITRRLRGGDSEFGRGKPGAAVGTLVSPLLPRPLILLANPEKLVPNRLVKPERFVPKRFVENRLVSVPLVSGGILSGEVCGPRIDDSAALSVVVATTIARVMGISLIFSAQ